MDTQEKSELQDVQPEKTAWQLQKESVYKRIPLSLKQLDVIIWTAVAALILVFIIIGLDAAGVF